MVTLNADNRLLLVNAKYSYLTNNYLSGQTSVIIDNSNNFARNDYVLFGNFGSEDSEIVQIDSVTAATHTLGFTAATKFAHAESTKVTILPYNQVRFYHTSTTTYSASDPIKIRLGDSTSQFDITNPAGSTFRYTWDGTGTDPCILANVNVGDTIIINAQNFNAANNGTFTITAVGTAGNNDFDVTNASGVAETNKTIGTGSIQVGGYINIQADDFYTRGYDWVNTTGYGWFIFYNSTTKRASSNSNAIPYGDFDDNTVKKVIDRFYSLLNNKELRLVTITDAFAWLNEAYNIARNELNLVNDEYNVSSSTTLTLTSGTKEYSISDNLGSDFSNLVSIYDEDNQVNIDIIKISEVPSNDENTGNFLKYYLRGGYIGFSPTPSSTKTLTIYYNTKTTELTSYTDVIDLPDNNFYILVDFMMSRAAEKLNKPTVVSNMQLFQAGLNRMRLVSHKRDNAKDSWGISPYANV